LVDVDSNVLGDLGSQLRVHLIPMLDHLFFDINSARVEVVTDVLDCLLPVVFREDISEEDTWLLVVGVGMSVCVPSSLPGGLELVPLGSWLLHRPTHSVGLVVDLSLPIVGDVHGAVPLVVVHSGLVGAIDGNLIIVGAKSVSVGVGVGEESALEHLVVGRFYAWHHVGGGEG